MKYRTLVIERKEYATVKRLLISNNYTDIAYKTSVAKLAEELKEASIIPEEEMPHDIVRINSAVTIKTPFGGEKTYSIVVPDKSNIAENRLSILAPMGLALFGYAQGDEIRWEFPSGTNIIKIVRVEQSGEVVNKTT